MGLLRRRRTPPASAGTPTGHMRNALHLVLAGDLAGAELALAEAARLDSSSADVYMALANLYRARGEIGRAIQIHQNVLLRPELEEAVRREALLGLALDFRAGGFLRRAQSSFEELLEVEPGNLRALREIERIKIETGDWEEAIRLRRKIGTRDPRSPAVLAHLWTGRARALLQAGDRAGGRRALKRALSYERGCAEAHLELGEDQLREGKPARAIEQWQRAIPLHPALGRVLLPRLAAAYQAAEDLLGFERLLRDRLEQYPEDLESAIWLAETIVRQGRVDEGLARLRVLLDRAPHFLPAYAALGRMSLEQGRESDALKVLEELLSRLPVARPRLRCKSCGTQDQELRWRCPQCGEWDSYE